VNRKTDKTVAEEMFMRFVKYPLKSSLTSFMVSLAVWSAAEAADDLPMPDLGDPSAASTAESSTDAPAPAAEPVAGKPDAATQTAEAPQEAESSGKAKPSRGRMMEEIVVTAQKREENLADVPIAVQAFSPAALEARGITNQAGLQRATPGLDVASNAGFTTIFLRGVGTEAFLTADPSIANYIDGVYFPFSPSFSQEFGAVKRVEVLKGPQGTLFGRNAVGGAINVITKEPDFEEAATDVAMTIGDFNTVKGSFYTNVPLTDSFAINASGFYTSFDSWLENSTAAGKPLEKEMTSGIKLKARWMPMEDLDLVFGLTKSHAQNNSDFPINLHPSPMGQALGVPAAGPYEGHVDENLYLNSDIQVLQFEGRYTAPWFDVKVLYSDQHDEQPFNYDFDGSEKPYVSFNILGHYADIQEAELQILSNENRPYSDWLTFTGGVFYFANRQGFDPIRVTVGNLDPTNLAAQGISVPAELQGFLNGVFGPGGSLPGIAGGGAPTYTLENQALAGTYSFSEFLQVTMKFTDWVSLTLGLRHQNEERHVVDSRTSYRDRFTNELVPVPNAQWSDQNQARDQDGNTVPDEDVTERMTPKVTFDFHPFLDDTLIYVSYQEAVKAHAYNTYAIYLAPEKVNAEETTAYEIGLKTSLFDGNLRVQAAAFYYEIAELQTQFVSLINGGAVSFENAGDAEIQGMDFDLTASILPSLISGLEGSLNGCWLKTAEYLNYNPASGFDKQTGLFSDTNDYSGNRITRSPKFTASAALTKTFTIPGGPLEVGADYYHNGGYWLSASNDPRLEQPKYALLGAHLSYEYEPWRVRASLAGTNITDEFYTAGVIGTDFGTNYRVAPPAQYSFTLAWSF